MATDASDNRMDGTEDNIPEQVRACLHLFDSVLGFERCEPDLREHWSCFRTWTVNVKANSRKGLSTLEHRLRDSSNIRGEILHLLQQLNEYLQDYADILTGKVTPWDQSGENDDAQAASEQGTTSTELEQICLGIGQVIQCLIRLGPAIKNPAPHDLLMASADAETEAETALHEHAHVKYLQTKYDALTPWLVDKLVRSISSRRHYFKYRRLSAGVGAAEMPSNTNHDALSPSLLAPSSVDRKSHPLYRRPDVRGLKMSGLGDLAPAGISGHPFFKILPAKNDVTAQKTEEETVEKADEEALNKKTSTDGMAKQYPGAHLYFKDALGRKYSFPYHLCSTWPVSNSKSPRILLYMDKIRRLTFLPGYAGTNQLGLS